MRCSVHLLLGLLQAFYPIGWAAFLNVHESCRLQCVKDVFANELRSYDDCMDQCFMEGGGNWMIRSKTVVCELFGHDNTAPPACSAGSADIVSYNVSTAREGFDAMLEYIIVEWTPCPYGIDDVRGYEVRLKEVNLNEYNYCKHVDLNGKLTLNELNASFSVVFSGQELTYGREYLISIEGLPKTAHRSSYPLRYLAKSCKSLNGPGSCVCGLDSIDPAPQPRATIQGYMINVTVPTLKSCFSVHMYKLVILSRSGKTEEVSTIREEIIPINEHHHVGHLKYSFSSVFPNARSDDSLYFQYRAIAYGGKTLSSHSLLLNVSNWNPNIPTSVGGVDCIVISWGCASASFNVSEYGLQLSWYGLVDSENIRHQHNYSFHSNCTKDGKMHVALTVRNGMYRARLREIRHSAPYATPWSSLSNKAEVATDDVVTFMNERGFIIAASVVFPFSAILTAILITCYCVKKGRCKKIHHRLPSPFPQAIAGRRTFEHHGHTVWIVWEADSKSLTHSEIHAANIRHLCAFLTNCCGLSVILDQFEVPSVASFMSWLQEKQKEAEFVLFICPHRAPLNNSIIINGVIGNFSAVFRLFQNALLSDEARIRFATILLPYSDPDCSDAARLLLSTTPVFALMDDIENFYFFIQGLRKAGPFGRHVVKFVNKREYAHTAEGLMFKNGVEEMLQIACDDAYGHTVEKQHYHSIADSYVLERGSQSYQADPLDASASLITHESNVKENCLEPVHHPPPLRNEMLERKSSEIGRLIPPPPLIPEEEEDPDQSLFVINSGTELLSLRPIESESIEPIIADNLIPLLAPDIGGAIEVHHPYSSTWLAQSGSIATCTTGLSSQAPGPALF